MVCYVKETLPFNKWNILQDEEIEHVCVTIGPRRLPSEVSNITFGVVYHPEWASNSATLDYLNRSLDTILQAHPQTGIILFGDFNHLPIAGLKNSCNLKQIVKKHTREDALLDLVLNP